MFRVQIQSLSTKNYTPLCITCEYVRAAHPAMLKRENVLYNLSKNIYFEIHKSWTHFIWMCLAAVPFQLFWRGMNIYFLPISFQIGLFESWGIKNECPISHPLQKKNINSASGHSTCFSLSSDDFFHSLCLFLLSSAPSPTPYSIAGLRLWLRKDIRSQASLL